MPQSLSRILLHLIFSTKNRVSCFTDSGVRKDLHVGLEHVPLQGKTRLNTNSQGKPWAKLSCPCGAQALWAV